MHEMREAGKHVMRFYLARGGGGLASWGAVNRTYAARRSGSTSVGATIGSVRSIEKSAPTKVPK